MTRTDIAVIAAALAVFTVSGLMLTIMAIDRWLNRDTEDET